MKQNLWIGIAVLAFACGALLGFVKGREMNGRFQLVSGDTLSRVAFDTQSGRICTTIRTTKVESDGTATSRLEQIPNCDDLK